MPTKIIWEDDNLAVLDKSTGILTHSTQKNEHNTLVDFVIAKWPEIKKYNWTPLRHPTSLKLRGTKSYAGQADNTRPGIVHRLDQNTSGLIVIAKNPETLEFLQNQFRSRKIKKVYQALVLGKVEPKEGEIISYLSRDNSGTIKHKSTHFNFTWQKNKPKLAITLYKLRSYYKYNGVDLSLLELEIKTGRTHQIRTHLKSKNWPIIGDQIYCTKESKKVSQKLKLNRQFLHSHVIKFELPNGETKEFISDLPNDLKFVLDSLNHISTI